MYLSCCFIIHGVLLLFTGKELREHATPQPDSSMPHREFCLRIPDDSHWTSSEPGTQLPTKSNHPNEQPTEPTNQGSSPLNLTPQLPKQTAQLDGGPVLPPKETTQPEYDNPVGMMAPYPPPVQSKPFFLASFAPVL